MALFALPQKKNINICKELNRSSNSRKEKNVLKKKMKEKMCLKIIIPENTRSRARIIALLRRTFTQR